MSWKVRSRLTLILADFPVPSASIRGNLLPYYHSTNAVKR